MVLFNRGTKISPVIQKDIDYINWFSVFSHQTRGRWSICSFLQV